MSDQSQNNSPSPSENTPPSEPAAPSLRDTIENAYDDVLDAADNEDSSDAGQSARARDNLGRFAANRDEPGEQSRRTQPRQDISETPRKPNEPAPEGSSTQLPAHWSAEFRADFDSLPPKGREILLRRHSEMEADYTRKSQAASGAVQFTQALAPVFEDPVVAQALQQSGVNAIQAVHEWGDMYRRASSPELRDRIGLLVDVTQRMGLDPARIFATGNQPQPPMGLSPEDMKDPAIQFFANHLGQTTNELQAVKAQLQQWQAMEANQRAEQVKEGYLGQINAIADETDQNGNPLRPYFDDPRVMANMLELFQLDPARDLDAAYRTACRMNDEVWQEIQSADNARLQSNNSVGRARAAVRGNLRGMTSPVGKPSGQAGNGSLRSTLEASADEVGL